MVGGPGPRHLSHARAAAPRAGEPRPVGLRHATGPPAACAKLAFDSWATSGHLIARRKPAEARKPDLQQRALS